ncbi:hypothetical protein C2S51_003089 [Perilla frutescens var. frutescens]|nr:hypothetical protein C2S51_003089 [Perilla frutescens var. frutescens]
MMVGHAREFLIIRDDHLLQRMWPDDLCFFSVHGEVGSGRLYVVKTLFDELCKGGEQCFKCCAWVTIGVKYELKEVLIRILGQVDKLAGDYEMLISLEDEKLWNYLCKALEHRRYMIVLEDVHDVKLLDCLRRSLPDRSNGSVVLLTTSSEEVSQLADSGHTFETPRWHVEQSVWFCLRLLIFGVEPISAELEEAGKKIVENCRGLLISVAKTFVFLYKTEKSLEQWSKIAADKENPIFIVGDEISELCRIKTEMQSSNWDMNDERDKALVGMMSTWIDFYCYVENIKMKMHPERWLTNYSMSKCLKSAGTM